MRLVGETDNLHLQDLPYIVKSIMNIMNIEYI